MPTLQKYQQPAVELRLREMFLSLFSDRIALGLNLGAEGTLLACAVRPMALMKSLALAKEKVNTVGFDQGAVLPLDWPDLSDVIIVTLDNNTLLTSRLRLSRSGERRC
jgi:hypothetical protein